MTSASRKFKASADIKLDALFDYSRVRPKPMISLDDDDEDVQVVTPMKPSVSGRPVKSADLEVGKENVVKSSEAVKVVDDDDWLLPPPPKPLIPRPVLSADPALLKVRQQMQELQTVWQASVRNIEEASKLEARVTEAAAAPQQPESGKRDSGTCQDTSNKRQKILLKLQGESGESHGVRIFVDDKLDKLFTHYANNLGKRPKTDFVFRFDGQQLDANRSPKDLDLEDEDIVEVVVKKART
ncbi:unnamed protein product [Calypogeia fissa]